MKKNLMRLFADNSGRGFSPKCKQEGAEATVYIYEAVGDWFGISASDFIRDFNALDAEVIHLRINSPGGDVFDARAIATAVRQSPAKVIAHIDGLAASAATYIALAADEVEMADGAFFMIHQAWTLAIGNSEDMLYTAELLDKVDLSITKDYAAKTGMSTDEIQEYMAAETWFTAEEAKEKGFVDRIYEGEEVSNRWDLDAYQNAPDDLAVKDEEEDKGMRERYERRLALLEIC